MVKHLFSEVNFTEALKKVVWISLWVGVYSMFIYLVFEKYFSHSVKWLNYFQSVFGIVLGLLLVFRSNRAYERWWEARTLWGQLVNACRNLSIKIDVLLMPTQTEAAVFAKRINQFCRALVIHLRQKSTSDDFKKLLNTNDLPKHAPSYLAKQLYQALVMTPKASEGLNLWLLDRELSQLMDICGGCEKIKNTLISISYRVIVKHVIIIFIILLPCSLVDNLGVWSIPATILISYLIIAVEGIARNLEEPFGLTEDHLNLKAITEGIENSVNEILNAPQKSD
jgi:ion channel-forming bestrophin family protein